MARSNKKANRGGVRIDRISDLPIHIIGCILQNLPIGDVVRTSILSRKWRCLWASVPRLDFGDEFFEKYKHVDISRVITEVLLLHNGPVNEFSLICPFHYPIRGLDKWILFLSRSGIKHLELLLNKRNQPHQMPSYLFSCQDLAYLELQTFKLSVPPNFCGFKSLTELHLSYIRFESNALESLISSCPLLDALTLTFCSGFESIDISAPTLKDFYIKENRDIKSIRLQNANNLIYLAILGDNPGQNFEKDEISNLIKCFLNLESLSLGASYIKIFSATIPQMLSSTINSLKYLELDGVNFNVSDELCSAICLLKSSPNLEDLVIKSCCTADEPVPMCLEELERNSCSFSQLQTVNITVRTYHELVLELIRFLLANSSSLKILTFKFAPNHPVTSKMLSIAQDLLGMERASPKAQVKFLYDGLTE